MARPQCAEVPDRAGQRVEIAVEPWLGREQQRPHVLAHHDEPVSVLHRLAQRSAPCHVGADVDLDRVSHHALFTSDGGQALVAEALRTAADVAAPAELAETRHVVVVDVPQHDAPIGERGDRRHDRGVEHVVHVDDVGIELGDGRSDSGGRVGVRPSFGEPGDDPDLVQLGRQRARHDPAHER